MGATDVPVLTGTNTQMGAADVMPSIANAGPHMGAADVPVLTVPTPT